MLRNVRSNHSVQCNRQNRPWMRRVSFLARTTIILSSCAALWACNPYDRLPAETNVPVKTAKNVAENEAPIIRPVKISEAELNEPVEMITFNEVRYRKRDLEKSDGKVIKGYLIDDVDIRGRRYRIITPPNMKQFQFWYLSSK